MSSPLHDTVCILNNEGTPVLKENENEILYRILQSVSLYIIEDKVEKDGVMYVTSHRLIWADALRTRARQWYLWQIEGDPRMEARNLFSVFSSTTSRILIIFKEPRKDVDMTQSKDYPTLSSTSTSVLPSTVSSSSSSSLSSLIRLVEVKISYGDKNINVLEDIRNALQRRAWLEERSNHLSLQSITNSIQTTTTTTTTRLGLAGIQEAESREKAAARAIAAEALRGDLASLEMHAKKMVVLAENYAIEVEKARIRKAAAAAAATTTTTTATTTVGLKQEISTLAEDEDSSWAQQMQNVGTFAAGMGIVSPVTKSMAGSSYISELARQLSIVLKPHLQRRGGIVSLTDAFCLLNRARGTEVVSPEDLVQAVGLLTKLQLGMRERNIEVSNKGERGGGGASFRAIQLDSFSDAAITSRILDMIDNSEKKNEGDMMMSMSKKSFVTSHGVSKALGIPVPLVTQILLQAEGNAILCRDESLAGLRFYKNVFKT